MFEYGIVKLYPNMKNIALHSKAILEGVQRLNQISEVKSSPERALTCFKYIKTGLNREFVYVYTNPSILCTLYTYLLCTCICTSVRRSENPKLILYKTNKNLYYYHVIIL